MCGHSQFARIIMVNTRGAETPTVEESPDTKRRNMDKSSKKVHAMSRSRSRSPSPAEQPAGGNGEGKVASVVVIPSTSGTSRKSNVRPSHSSSERRSKSKSREKHSEPSMTSVLKDLTDVFKRVENRMANMDSKISGLSELLGNIPSLKEGGR